MFGFSNQSPGKRMFSTKTGNTNRTTADMMNGNCHHQTRNFGGPFAPPPQCYQPYCNKSQHFGMGGITLGDYGIYPVHGVYHNPYKTFCSSPCNMNVSGTDYNHGRNGYQKTNFQNYYKPMARTQACTEPVHGAATGGPFNGNGLINGIKNFVNNMIQPKYDFYTDHNRRYNPKYRNNYKHDQQYVPVQRYTDGCLASFVFNFQPQIPVPKVHTVNCPQNSTKSPNKDDAFQNPKEIKPCTPPNQQKSNVQNQPNDVKITVLSVSSAKSDPVPCKTATPEVIAIFTSDDFPELPKPKKSVSPWKPDPKSKSSYFRNTQGPTRLHQSPVKSAKNSENVSRPKLTLQSLSKPRRVSECDSDDSFVVLPKPIPTSPIAKSVTPPSLPPTNRFHSGLLPFRQRQRQISECSDDSFVICFQDESGNGNSDIDFSDISDDSDSDEDEVDGELCNVLSDDDIDDDDEKYVNTTKLDTLTLKDNNHISNYGSPAFRETSQPDSGFDEQKDKKVRFDLKPKVHVMRSWDYAYRAARKGPWEQIARDRCRFKQRIENLGAIISPVLARNHREKIYNARFCDTDNNNVKTITDDCKNITLDQECKSKIEQTQIKSIENQYPIEENQPICITT